MGKITSRKKEKQSDVTRTELEAAATDLVETMVLSETILNTNLSKLSVEELKNAITEVAVAEVIGTDNFKNKVKESKAAGLATPTTVDAFSRSTVEILNLLGCNPGVDVREVIMEEKEETIKEKKMQKSKSELSRAKKTYQKKDMTQRLAIRNALLNAKSGITKKELMIKLGITNPQIVANWISYLKNPKYAGKEGPISIIRIDNYYFGENKNDNQ